MTTTTPTTRTATTRTLATDGAVISYDVYGPLPAADGRPPLVMIGQPMDASGFATLAGLLRDRTVVSYDPRGIGRSTRSDGVVTNDPVVQAEDVHALIESIGAPVELLGSSGGAVTALALVTAHPDDVTVLVAHEPPLLTVLPDAERAAAGEAAMQQAYHERGQNHGMAAFMAFSGWSGEFTADYLAQPLPDPAAFGMPTDDDGTRTNPLLSGVSNAITAYRPDWEALRAAPTRIVLAYGVETGEGMTARATWAAADRLGVEATEFPSHHGGFMGGEFGYAGQPEAFAARLREVLAG